MPPTKNAKAAAASPPGRGRGRPAKLSELMIIEGALALLATGTAEELTLARLAKSLDTAVMSLYNYFPNRDALLEGVANHAFAQLELPPPGECWQTNLLAWLRAVQTHFDRYPVVAKTMGWERKIPAAWLHVTVPVLRELKKLGLNGPELSFAAHWFLSSATGLMLVEASAPAFRGSDAFAALAALPLDEQEILLEVRQFQGPLDRQALLDYGFRQIISGLEPLLPKKQE